MTPASSQTSSAPLGQVSSGSLGQEDQHEFDAQQGSKTDLDSSIAHGDLRLAPSMTRETSGKSSTHSRSASLASNFAQHRLSIAPSLAARHSLLSQYSPVIEQATEISVLKSHSTSPQASQPFDLPPYRRASMSEVLQGPSLPLEKRTPTAIQNQAMKRSISIEKVRESTNDLKTLLQDMKALRSASMNLGQQGSRTTPQPSSEVLSASTQLPASNSIEVQPDTASVTSFEPAQLDSIAPPAMPTEIKAKDNKPIATRPTTSAFNSMVIPTKMGSGIVPKTSASHLDKELPLPPVLSSTEQVDEVRPVKPSFESDRPSLSPELSNVPHSPDTAIAPAFPLPMPPPKSGLRHSQSSSIDAAEVKPTIEKMMEEKPSAPSAQPALDGLRIQTRGLNVNKTIEYQPHSLALAPTTTTESSVMSTGAFNTAPSSPLKVSGQMAGMPAHLEGLPAPPFSAPNQAFRGSSTESFLTAKSKNSDNKVVPRSLPPIPVQAAAAAVPLAIGALISTATPTFQQPQHPANQSSVLSPLHASTVSRSPGSTLMSPGVQATPDTQTTSPQVTPLKIRGPPSAGRSVKTQRSVSSPLHNSTMADNHGSSSTFRPLPLTPDQRQKSPGIYYDGSSSEGETAEHEPRPPAEYPLGQVNRPEMSRLFIKGDLRENLATPDSENLVPTSAWQEVPLGQSPLPRGTSSGSMSYQKRTSRRRVVSMGAVENGADSMVRKSKLSYPPVHRHGGGTKRHGSHSSDNSSSDGVAEEQGYNPRQAQQRRPFSQATIQHLLEMSKNSLRLEDVEMSPTERVLIEKFVNSLAKLSADINDDAHKRPEGIRRLHNALRAIEGWI